MSVFQWLLPLGLVLMVGFAFWKFRTGRTASSIELIAEGRRKSSRLVGRAEFIDGNRHVPVALALSKSTFFYENSDMQGSLELHWIHEVEYENELLTGQSVGDGKVLRLRCFSQNFEFLLKPDAVAKWQAALPPHQLPAQQLTAQSVTG